MNVQEPVTLTADYLVVGGPVPAGSQRIFTALGVHNPTAAAILLTINLVPDKGNPVDGNKIINRPVNPGKTDVIPELIGRGLNAGGTLQVKGAGLNFGFTSIETTIG